MTAETPALELEDLTVAYGAKPALWDIDLTVPKGVMMALIGPNGAGKSTLIKAVMGLIKPAAGTIRLLGQPIGESPGKIAYVPQKSTVDWEFPVTVKDVALMGCFGRLGWFQRPSAAERKATIHALNRVGIAHLANRPIHQLSGGQQQRVFLARALVQDAELLVLDEPFQGVDAGTEQAVFELLSSLRDAGRTIVVVHHDLQTVADHFDHVGLLKVRLIASGPVAQVMTRENLSLAFGQGMQIEHPGVPAPRAEPSTAPQSSSGSSFSVSGGLDHQPSQGASP